MLEHNSWIIIRPKIDMNVDLDILSFPISISVHNQSIYNYIFPLVIAEYL